jgi:hypothetical protein
MKTGQRIKIKEHFPPNSDAYYEATPQRLLSQSRFIVDVRSLLSLDGTYERVGQAHAGCSFL